MPKGGASLEEKQRCMRERHASSSSVLRSEGPRNLAAVPLEAGPSRTDPTSDRSNPESGTNLPSKRVRGDVRLELADLLPSDEILMRLVDDWIVPSLVDRFLDD